MKDESSHGPAPEVSPPGLRHSLRFDLSGRTALVTGSSRGIGAALALGLAGAGADVAIHFTGNRRAAESVGTEIRDFGRRTVLLQTDLGEPDAGRLLVESVIRELGGIDILILNASVQIPKPWETFTAEEIDRHYAVNYRSSLDLLQRTVPLMSARGWGRIITIGSVQERRPHPRMLPYSSLKHAQTGLILSLAKQLAETGVTANAIAPGVIVTDRNSAALADPEYSERVRAAIPAGRFGDPEDCVGAALLLCSNAGSYITGQNLFIDGGLGLA